MSATLTVHDPRGYPPKVTGKRLAPRLETLDGPSREVVRANDHVTVYLPDARVVLVERRSTRHMPVMLPERLSETTRKLLEKLDVEVLTNERVTEVGPRGLKTASVLRSIGPLGGR